ncbi:hypothetical protein LZC95_43130 [Pendulispora brunnea]|uniref:Uncharacterized protein n=1 Tax=Pendulispora brunnea TaxID=2905690 RepID=A0ABZ2K6R9_9BACT
MRHLRAVLLISLASAIPCGIACSLNNFSREFGQDAATISDGGAGARFCANKDAAYCFDFDQLEKPADYFTDPKPGQGTVAFDTSEYVSPPRSLSVGLPADAGKTSYSVMVNQYRQHPTELTYEVHFQVAQAPIPSTGHPSGDEAIFATIMKISFERAPNDRDLAIHVRGQDGVYKVYAYEHGYNVEPDGGPGFNDLEFLGRLRETQTPTSWSKLILRVRTVPELYVSAQLNDENERPLRMAPNWQPIEPAFSIGLSYAQPLASPWTIRYDDILIDMKGN